MIGATGEVVLTSGVVGSLVLGLLVVTLGLAVIFRDRTDDRDGSL